MTTPEFTIDMTLLKSLLQRNPLVCFAVSWDGNPIPLM